MLFLATLTFAAPGGTWPTGQDNCSEVADAGVADRRTFLCGEVTVSTGVYRTGGPGTREDVADFVTGLRLGIEKNGSVVLPDPGRIRRRGPDLYLHRFRPAVAADDALISGMSGAVADPEGVRYYVCTANETDTDPNLPCFVWVHTFVRRGPPPAESTRVTRVDVAGYEIELPAPCAPTTLPEWPNAVTCPDGTTLAWMRGATVQVGADLDASLDHLVGAATSGLRSNETREVDYHRCDVVSQPGRCATVTYGVNHEGGVIAMGIGADSESTIIVMCMQIGTPVRPTESCRSLVRLH